MSRRVVAALALALSLLSPGHSAAPQQKPERPGLRLPALQPGEHLAAQVRQVVDFQGLDDPKTTLIEALDQLAKVHRITFDVNERAFKEEGVFDVLKTPIAETSPIPPMRTRLGTVLDKILARVPGKSGVAYLVRNDRLEVTTVAALREEVWGKDYRGPFLPLVHLTANAWELDDALAYLAEQANRSVTLDPRLGAKARAPITTHFLNQPFDSALFLLTDMADLAFVRIDATYHVTTRERAETLKAALAKLRPRAAPEKEKPAGGKGDKAGR
jgi:hypothetical protein